MAVASIVLASRVSLPCVRSAIQSQAGLARAPLHPHWSIACGVHVVMGPTGECKEALTNKAIRRKSQLLC